jgi:uncharacterized protein involved in tellurium resistance
MFTSFSPGTYQRVLSNYVRQIQSYSVALSNVHTCHIALYEPRLSANVRLGEVLILSRSQCFGVWAVGVVEGMYRGANRASKMVGIVQVLTGDQEVIVVERTIDIDKNGDLSSNLRRSVLHQRYPWLYNNYDDYGQ